MSELINKLHAAYRDTEAKQVGMKKVAYLSLEWLEGRASNNAAINLGLPNPSSDEVDAGLGNGGLGRLASCFIDSCATLGIPMRGYGLFYDNGLFKQSIKDGEQQEQPDIWKGPTESSFMVRREDRDQVVRFADFEVTAQAFDRPIPGYRNGVANTLRLWYVPGLTEDLYPNDNEEAGKYLRLRQQFILSAASIADLIDEEDDFIIQMNDTHPTVSIPELMRVLMDDLGYSWDDAMEEVQVEVAYTCHTLLPEALEQWPVEMFRNILPRQLEIIEELDRRTRK